MSDPDTDLELIPPEDIEHVLHMYRVEKEIDDANVHIAELEAAAREAKSAVENAHARQRKRREELYAVYRKQVLLMGGHLDVDNKYNQNPAPSQIHYHTMTRKEREAESQ